LNDIRELYQDMILDHSRSPRNYGVLEASTCSARGHNPLCGDDVQIHIQRSGDGKLEKIHFEGSGCAISTASASILTDVLAGRDEKQVREIFTSFRAMVTGEGSAPEGDGLAKLAVFSGVREYPSRIKCAILAWHTLIQALDGVEVDVSTE